MNATRVLTVAVWFLCAAYAAADADKSTVLPAGAPLEARLVVTKDKYVLKKDDKKPGVELALEIKNTSKNEIKLWESGDSVLLDLVLKGPGVEKDKINLPPLPNINVAKGVTIEAGKTLTIPIKDLRYGFRLTQSTWWTKPGDYTLEATLMTAMSPVPKDAEAANDGMNDIKEFGKVAIKTAPVKLKVVEKE